VMVRGGPIPSPLRKKRKCLPLKEVSGALEKIRDFLFPNCRGAGKTSFPLRLGLALQSRARKKGNCLKTAGLPAGPALITIPQKCLKEKQEATRGEIYLGK